MMRARLVAHLRQVRWLGVAADLIRFQLLTFLAYIAATTRDMQPVGMAIAGAAIAGAVSVAASTLVELVHPKVKRLNAQTRRYKAEISRLSTRKCDLEDRVAELREDNDRLHNENADLADQGDQLQDRIDKLENENADLNGRIQDLADERIGVEA